MKKMGLKKISLGAILISLCLFLSQINILFPFINSLKMPLVYANYWVFWHFPLIIIGFFFKFSHNLLFLLIYFFLDIFFYSFPRYFIYSNFLNLGISQNSLANKGYFLSFMIFFGVFVPILSYLLTSFLFYNPQINYKKIFFYFLLISLIQSISRTINGYIIFFDQIKQVLKNELAFNIVFFSYVLNIFENSYVKSFCLIWIFNFIPVFISNMINIMCFLIFRKTLIRLHNQFYHYF